MLRTYDLSTGDGSPQTNLEIPKNICKNAYILTLLSLPFHRLCGILSSWLRRADPPLWLLGFSDGNIYALSLNGCDRLMNVGYQPVKDILFCPKSSEFPEIYDGIVSIGKQGKINLLSSKSGKVAQLEGNAPTPVQSCCIQGTNLIYTDGNASWRIGLKVFQTEGCDPVKLPFCGITALTPTKNKEWLSALGLLSTHGMIYCTKLNYETQSGDSLPLSLPDATHSLKPLDILKQMHLCPSRLHSVNKDKEIHEEFIEQLSLCVTGDNKQLKKQISVAAKVVRMELLEQEQVFLEVTNNSGFFFRYPFWRIRISVSSPVALATCRVLPLGDLKNGTHYKTFITLPKGPLPQEVRISCALLFCPPTEYLNKTSYSEEFGFQVLLVLSLDDILLDQLHFLSPPTAIVKKITRFNVLTNESQTLSNMSLEEQIIELAKTKPGHQRILGGCGKEKRKIKTVVSVLKSLLDIGSKELLMLLMVDCEQRDVEMDSQERIRATLNDCHVELFAQETDRLLVIQIEGENGQLISGIKAALIRRLKKLDLMMTTTDTATLPETVTSKIQELSSVLENEVKLDEDDLYKLHGILRSNITAALPIL